MIPKETLAFLEKFDSELNSEGINSIKKKL